MAVLKQVELETEINHYSEALAFVESLNISTIALGLSRMRRLLSLLDHPQNDLSIVHIGGTNGKGSVSAMLTRIFRAAGYRVGTFVSPHLQDIRERVLLNGEWIDLADFCQEVESLRATLHHHQVGVGDWPTYFEFLNLLAFRYFQRQGVDLVFMEVGLGGRLDSTNVIETPLLSVITSLSIDHEEYLGSSLKEIAGEKAGIIKVGVPLVLGPKMPKEALDVFIEKSEEVGSPLLQADSERCIERGNEGDLELSGNKLKGRTLWDSGREIELTLPLLGAYQVQNLATVLTVLDALKCRGFDVSKEALKMGLKSVHWPARFDYYPEQALVIDGGHNAEGFRVLGEGLRAYFQGRSLVWLVSLRLKRPLKALVELISGFEETEAVYCVPGPNASQYYSAELLEQSLRSVLGDSRDIRRFESVGRALSFFHNSQNTQGDSMVSQRLGVVCGSLYTAGEAIQSVGRVDEWGSSDC